MMKRDKFDRDSTAQKIINGLKCAGLDVKLNERHDITIRVAGEYKKCSGSAYKISKDRAYAHGTMLLASDLGNLGPALRPASYGIVGNGVESVRSKVANLNLTHEEFCAILAKAFQARCHKIEEEEMMAIPEVAESRAQLISDHWKYSQTPVFTQTITTGAYTIIATSQSSEDWSGNPSK
ncbi:Lipoate-protein ligase A [Taphrina deformans PYCC 5710]|uniref:Putative lipoate-protein ligase A n=1 Tax=Taphrina deformans (strain PYCC 5710 / ATCC 11124 / CBS 356.35 / IMI 108563 / JCM 9778 / NBRC 8474) TaxID=1097556 RepID=R4X8S2_TAPDE|nr:Lipoate-protein ligase A [Taphrina deformans PYCC 5710]|eukprot:CCG82043.1 Lipoate-protein ligase A [Taphrina deformans PYCC 5710]